MLKEAFTKNLNYGQALSVELLKNMIWVYDRLFFTVFLILPANGFPRFLSLGKKILEFRGKFLEFREKILSLGRKNWEKMSVFTYFF